MHRLGAAALIGLALGTTAERVAAVPTDWALDTRVAEVEIRATEGLLISGNDLELLDPETGENRLRLILFDGARRFSAAFAGNRPMVLEIEVRDLFSAKGFGRDIYALELAYRLLDRGGGSDATILAQSTWRSIEHRIPDIAEARNSLAAAVQRDLVSWMADLDCAPGSCSLAARDSAEDEPALSGTLPVEASRAVVETGEGEVAPVRVEPVALSKPPPQRPLPDDVSGQLDGVAPASADPVAAKDQTAATGLPNPDTQAALAALLDGERAMIRDVARPVAPVASAEATAVDPPLEGSRETDGGVTLADPIDMRPPPPRPQRAIADGTASTTPVVIETAETGIEAETTETETDTETDTETAEAPIQSASPPPAAQVRPPAQQPRLGEARWIGSTDAAPADGDEPGLWIASDMIEAETEGWAADETTGSIVKLLLRPSIDGQRERAVMSAEAMAALGLVPGQYAILSLYLPRQ